MASVSPTGPAPAISTSVSTTRALLIDLDVRGPNHLGPFLRLRADVRIKRLRRGRSRFHAHVAHARLDLFVIEGRGDFCVQPGHDGRRRAGWGHDTEPTRRVIPAQPGFRGSRHIWKLRQTFWARHRI